VSVPYTASDAHQGSVPITDQLHRHQSGQAVALVALVHPSHSSRSDFTARPQIRYRAAPDLPPENRAPGSPFADLFSESFTLALAQSMDELQGTLQPGWETRRSYLPQFGFNEGQRTGQEGRTHYLTIACARSQNHTRMLRCCSLTRPQTVSQIKTCAKCSGEKYLIFFISH